MAMRISNIFVSKKLWNTSIVSLLLIFVSVLANAQTNSGAAELRVVVPIANDASPTTKADLKAQLLSEKLIKMGRARAQGCTRCHGRSGMDRLASAVGWEKSIVEFVVKQLSELRDGTRAHAVMSSVAKPLSDQDIALIAAWYQSVSPSSKNNPVQAKPK